MKNVVYPENWFLAILVLSLQAVVWLLRKSVLVTIAVLGGVGGLISAVFFRPSKEAKPTPKAVAKPAQPVQAAAQGQEFQDTVFVDKPTLAAGDFKIADRLLSIPLDPDVAVVHLRVYYSEKLVRRWMVVKEPMLRALMKAREHALPDASFDPKVGLEAIKAESVVLAEKLINSFGKPVAVKAKEVKVEATKATPAPQPRAAERTKETRNDEGRKAARPMQRATVPPPPPGQRYVPTATVGETFEGELIEAAPQTIRPVGRDPYEVFQARLRLANGAEIPFRGAELERELSAVGIKLGERIAITPQGKVPVELAGGKKGTKNVYRVDRL